MASMDPVSRLRRLEPDRFHALVKMHLSFLLDLNTDSDNHTPTRAKSTPTKSTPMGKSKLLATPLRILQGNSQSSKGVMDGAVLTQEGVCQVNSIIKSASLCFNVRKLYFGLVKLGHCQVSIMSLLTSTLFELKIEYWKPVQMSSTAGALDL